jgi:hypothetical protein
MPSLRSLRFLAIPAAAGLAVVVVVACSERNLTTSPDSGGPLFAAGAASYYDDSGAACKNNDRLIGPGSPGAGYNDSFDANNNDLICQRVGNGKKKK